MAVAGVTPVPETATECGLPGVLSKISKVAVRAPAAAGAKATEIVQDPPACWIEGQYKEDGNSGVSCTR